MANLHTLKQHYTEGILPKPDFIKAMYGIHQHLFDYARLLTHTDIESIEIKDGQVVMTSRTYGIQVVCDPQDMRTAPLETLNFNQYESDEAQMVMQLMSDGMTVLDIGANVGWYSMAIAKQYPQTRVHAFEPIPTIFSTLKQNVALNQLDNITLHNQGFSNQAGEATFYYVPEMGVNASMRNVAERDTAELSKAHCQIDTVDHFVNQHPLTIDFIKCDVEGAEYLVFQGAKDTLQRDKPIIFSELLRKWSAQYNYHPNDMLNYLSELGYQCYCPKNNQLVPFGQMDDNTVETNFLFLHPQQHDALIRQYTAQ